MLAKCPAAAFLQGELKKQGKKKRAKPNQPESQPEAKPNQPGAKPNQPESQPGAKPNQPGAKPNQPGSQAKAKPNQPESQPGAKPNQPESQPEAKPTKKSQPGFPLRALALQKRSCWAFCQTAYLGVSILQPHACTQRFRLRILRRTRSNAGRTSAGSLSGRI